MKLKKHIPIEGFVTTLTGLKIGGTVETAGIGETDNPIIRHPVTGFPYIPGSSLKGKIRSLLELNKDCCKDTTQKTGEPCWCTECTICKLFGSNIAHRQVNRSNIEPTRLIFRDSVLTDESWNELNEALPGAFVEVKSEIAIDRKTGTTSGGLRQFERVPEGYQFEFSVILRVFEEDLSSPNGREFLSYLADGIEMLEKDCLGGCGTRGYGQVKFTVSEDVESESLSEHIRKIELS